MISFFTTGRLPTRNLRLTTAGILSLLAFVLPAPALAQTWYQVEVIVFDEPGTAGKNEESWADNPGVPDLTKAIELVGADGLSLSDGDSVPHAYRLINPSRLSLRGVWSRLGRSGQFRPLAHLGWQQPGLGPRSARAVHLIAWGNATGGGAGLSPIVDGTLRIYRTRFLHAEVDLLYRPEGGQVLRQGIGGSSGQGSGSVAVDQALGSGSAYRLAIKRKMRSKELHYIDHPLFSLLIRVTPLAAQ